MYIAAQTHMVELRIHDHLGYTIIFLASVEVCTCGKHCLGLQFVVILTYLVLIIDNLGILSTNQGKFPIITAET